MCVGDREFLEDENTKNFARKVADHYSARTNQTLEEREASVIIHLKKLNNWVFIYIYIIVIKLLKLKDNVENFLIISFIYRVRVTDKERVDSAPY